MAKESETGSLLWSAYRTDTCCSIAVPFLPAHLHSMQALLFRRGDEAGIISLSYDYDDRNRHHTAHLAAARRLKFDIVGDFDYVGRCLAYECNGLRYDDRRWAINHMEDLWGRTVSSAT